MWKQRSSFEQSNVMDVTIQCQFNVATKNVMEFSTMYATSPRAQTTHGAYPATCVQRTHPVGTTNQCRYDNVTSDNVTPDKPSYQCAYEPQQCYFDDSESIDTSDGVRFDSDISYFGHPGEYSSSCGFNTSGAGYYTSCMNDSGYGSPHVQHGHEKVFSSCVGLQSQYCSAVLENVSNVSSDSDVLSQCGDAFNGHPRSDVNSPVTTNSVDGHCEETEIAMREKDVIQRLFSLREVDNESANHIEHYYQSQTTVIDVERHNLLSQMTYGVGSSHTIHTYYNRKLLSLLKCVEGKLSTVENRKCKTAQCKTKNDRKSRLLPKHAVKVMQIWYEENLDNPYPSREVTLSIATEGAVTVEQIRKWFANKRNRSRNNKLKASDKDTDEL